MNRGLIRFAEANDAVGQCEQRVVIAASYVFAGMPFCAALSDEDAPRFDNLSRSDFDAQAFCVGVTSISRRSLSFLMCHCLLPILYLGNFVDLNS